MPTIEDERIVHCGLTVAEFKRFDGACHQTWNEIASDALQLNDGKDMPQAEVVELVCDADRLLTGGGMPSKEWVDFYIAKVKPMLEKHYGTPEFIAMMKQVFKYDRYGY